VSAILAAPDSEKEWQWAAYSRACVALAGLPALATSADRIDLTFTGEAPGSLRLFNATATDASDVVTKGYVDSVASGLDVKASVAAKTVSALAATYAVGVWTASANEALPMIDAVALIVGSRVLVDQTGSDGDEGGGIFAVTSVGGLGAPWTLARASDADTTAKVKPGMFVFVTGGATAGDRGYVLTTDVVDNLDSNTLEFSQFTSVSAAVPGAPTQLIFNDGGVLAGSSKAIFDKDSGDVTLSTGSLALSTGSIIAGELGAPGATIGLKAIPQAESGTVAGSEASTASLATAMSVLSTLPFDGTTTVSGSTTRARKITIPAGSVFFPLGALVWCSSLTVGGDSHYGVVALTARASSDEVAKITINQPNYLGTGPGVGHSRLQWSASSNKGVGGASAADIIVDVDVTGSPSDTYDLRFGLIGFLVKAEA
jgi:hypothetical protein